MKVWVAGIAILLAGSAPAVGQVQLTPNHVACANGQGDVEPAAQEAACTAVIKLGGAKDNLAIAYGNRGNSFLRRDQIDKALQDYDQAIRLDPKFADAWRNRGSAYFNLGQYDKAVENYDQLIRLEPKEAGGYAERCSARAVVGKAAAAKPDCDKALEIEPSHVEARAWRTLVYLQLGRIDDADLDILLTVGGSPKDPALHYLWGMVLEAQGKKQDAEDHFQLARELDAGEFARLDKLFGRFRKPS